MEYYLFIDFNISRKERQSYVYYNTENMDPNLILFLATLSKWVCAYFPLYLVYSYESKDLFLLRVCVSRSNGVTGEAFSRILRMRETLRNFQGIMRKT